MKNDIYEVKKLGVEGVVVGIVDNKEAAEAASPMVKNYALA